MNTLHTLAIASDHAGFGYKEMLKPMLEEMGYALSDFGTDSEASCDYPDAAHPLALAVETGACEQGIIICGSGNGVCITVNKHAGVRGALAWDTEIAALARQHNDANVLCLPARFVSEALAQEIVRTFLSTEFEGGRHQRRVDKINLQ